MNPSMPLKRAASILRAGGVVAYPTEGVYGLGCLPSIGAAVERVLAIKQREPKLGLILIAAEPAQLEGWIADDVDAGRLESTATKPVTWIVRAADDVPWHIRGEHSGIAVRVTAHPVAAALCRAAGSALVSTSANLSGQSPTRNPWVLRRSFGSLVDFIVPGRCGEACGASEIRDFESGKVLRPAAT
ncbi:MAG: L-threonylcarbamoyladenylate synthase [Woeseiaceae bacterium]